MSRRSTRANGPCRCAGSTASVANKLLVLVDGRSVYNRLFSGVLWDGEELMLDDIDRIEVIRGPGAAVWGANAVNGVINIVTKSAADTQGGFARVEAGRAGTQGAVRFGGTVGTTRYRLFAQWTGRDESLIAPGTPADDASETVTTGFRTDWITQPDAFMLEGAFTAGRAHALWSNLDPQTFGRQPISTEPSDRRAAISWAAGAHTRTGGSTLQIQAFIDVAEPGGAGRRATAGTPSTSTRNTTRRSVRITTWWAVPVTGSSARASTDTSAVSLTPAEGQLLSRDRLRAGRDRALRETASPSRSAARCSTTPIRARASSRPHA